MNLATILSAMTGIGPVVAALPAVKKLIEEGIAALKTTDQAKAKEAYADLIADNDTSHLRLQEKLDAAARRT